MYPQFQNAVGTLCLAYLGMKILMTANLTLIEEACVTCYRSLAAIVVGQ